MRIAARATVGDFDLKWLVKYSVTNQPSYQNHYLVARHAMCPWMSRVEFLGHREDCAAESYARAVELAHGSPMVRVVDAR